MIQKPLPGEYAPVQESYIQAVPDQADVIDLLQQQQQEIVQLLSRVTESEADFAYAPGKWSIKELLGHMTDTERIMSYRALCIARGEQASLPGFDENVYVTNANFSERTLQDLLEEHQVVRQATLALFRSLTPEALSRTGTANGTPVKPGTIAFILTGHERHHLNILKERYLAKL